MCLATIVLASCGGRQALSASDGLAVSQQDSAQMITPKYAKGFNVKYADDMTLLDINDPETAKRKLSILLLLTKISMERFPTVILASTFP